MKNLTKKSNEELMVIDFEQDAGKGFENTTAEDYTLPIVRVIQNTSHQLDPSSDKYIDGAKIGDIYNIATKENYGDSIRVVPITYFKKWVEYVPRGEIGGFVTAHDYDDKNLDFGEMENISFSSYLMKNGNELVETGYFPVLILKNNIIEHAIIAIESTKWKFAKQWLTCMKAQKLPDKGGKMFTPSFFSYIYKIKTKTEKNNKGTWKGYYVADFCLIDNHDAYQQAKDMNSKINEGLITIRHEDEQEVSSNNDITPTEEDLDIHY